MASGGTTGAGGTTGMTRVANAAPDGYTIAVGNAGTQSAAPSLYPNLQYDPAKSFQQIGIVNYTPQIIAAKKATEASDLASFLKYLAGNSAKLNYGLNKVRFPHPVKVGQRVRAQVRLGDVIDLPAGKQVSAVYTIEIEGQAKPACVAETVVLLLP